MKNVASAKWTLAAVAVATVAGLALLSVASVEAVQSGQSSRDEEVAVRIQAEIEARLAEVQRRLEEQMVELQAVREHRLAEVQERLAALHINEAQFGEQLQAELMEVQEHLRSRSTEEALRHARESMRGALASAHLAAQRAPRAVTIRSFGSCDSYGELVLDYAEDLELSEEQTDAIRATRRNARRDGIERRADIEVAEMDLEALYEADDTNLTAVRAKLEELAMLGVDEQMAGFTLRQEVRSALTPTQLEELDELRADHNNISIVVGGWSRGRTFSRIGC